MFLSSEQKLDYKKNGYLVLADFVSPEECDLLIRESETLVQQFEPDEVKTIFSTVDQERTTNDYFLSSGDEIRFFFEPNAFLPDGNLRQKKELSINKIGHALHELNPIFSQFSRKRALSEICSDLECKNPLLMQSMYIFKQPRIGAEVTCHQDATFLFTEPMSVIGFWFALQDATLSNGCLHALPGGHHTPLKRKYCRNSVGNPTFQELDSTPWPTDGYVPLEAKKGSLIILHGLLPHLSGPNTSDLSRHAYTLHVIDGTTHYPKDNWLQRVRIPVRGFDNSTNLV